MTEPTASNGATAEAPTPAQDDDFYAGIVAAKEAIACGDNATANRILNEVEARQRSFRDANTAVGVDAVDVPSPAQGELQPGLQSAEDPFYVPINCGTREDVNRAMERVRARAEDRERVTGEPAVLPSTDGGPLRYRDEHGNVGPLPRSRERERLVVEMERFSRLNRPEQQLYEALGAVRERRAGCALPAARPRESRARPRTRARRAAHRGATRAGPSDDDGESEPAGVAAHACRRRIAGGRP